MKKIFVTPHPERDLLIYQDRDGHSFEITGPELVSAKSSGLESFYQEVLVPFFDPDSEGLELYGAWGRLLWRSVEPEIEEIVEVLNKEFSPIRLFFFGSRVSGNAHGDSDYDFLLVVKEIEGSRIDAMIKARRLLSEKYAISSDVFIYDEDTFNLWKNELSSIPEVASNLGREILLK